MKVKEILQLQDLEQRIENLKKALRALEKNEQELLFSINAIDQEEQKLKSQIENLEKRTKELEENIQVCKERIKKAEKNLALVKKAEDYKRVLRERANNENCVIKLSKELQEVKKTKETLRKELENYSIQAQRKRQHLTLELQEVRSDMERIQKELQEAYQEVQKLKEAMDKATLEEYEKLKAQVGLPVMVKVDTFRACGGCGMVLPSSLYMELVASKVVKCPSCKRLVYYET